MKSRKIKKITLNGFRAFSNEVVFDFEKKGAVSDIVVIYAPNGTGKTSTIEGVEWATTGKISRIDRIIKDGTSPRNRNPKEGYILKNRQSSTTFATVLMELDNGEYINRSTKPKGNRNNDYCRGVLDSTVENADAFGTNILSQGNISRFSYEASNGNLFESLISSKDNSNDIKLYDQLKSLKTKVEASYSENKSKNSLLIKLMSDEEKKILELDSSKVKGYDFESAYEYALFRDNFSIFKDFSKQSLDEKILYLGQSTSSLQFIKEKLLEFDIDFYRKLIVRISLIKKIMLCDREILNIKRIADDLKKSLDKMEKEAEEIDILLLDKNIDFFSSIIKAYKDTNFSINKKQDKSRKLTHVTELLYCRISNINVEELKDIESRILQVESLLSSLFYGVVSEDVVLENESGYINNIDVELTGLNKQLASLSKNSFIALNPEFDEVKKISAYTLELENINLRIKQLTSEKHKLKSFEDKLGLIKSSIIDIVTEEKLSDCPSCGTKFNDMTSLLATINSVEAGADNLFDNFLNDCNSRKVAISIEIEVLHKSLDSLLSEKIIDCNDKIKMLNEKKRDAIKLYSLLSTLNVDFISLKLTDITYKLKEKKRDINIKYSTATRKKEKYSRWLNQAKRIIREINDELVYDKNKLQQLTEDCIEVFGLNVDEVKKKFSYGHVILFDKKRLSQSIKSTHQLHEDKTADINRMKNKASDLRNKEGYSQEYDLHDLLEEALISKKLIKTNYNYLKENIKTFNIHRASYFVAVIIRIEGFFSSLMDLIRLEKDTLQSKRLLDDYKAECQVIKEKMESSEKKISQINESLDDALKYFSELASNSINNDILNDMFMYIEPHLKYDKIQFKVDLTSGNKGIYIQTHSAHNNESTTPIYYLSEAQINILSICIFLADHAKKSDGGINTIIIDDPVQSMDDLNSYALIDLCKLFARRFDKQIIITTHNKNFFNLFQEKLPESRYATKFISL